MHLHALHWKDPLGDKWVKVNRLGGKCKIHGAMERIVERDLGVILVDLSGQMNNRRPALL